MTDPIHTFRTIDEISSGDKDKPFTGVIIDGKKAFDVNPQSAWEVDRIYTDFVPVYEPHGTLIVVFKRKDTEEMPD